MKPQQLDLQKMQFLASGTEAASGRRYELWTMATQPEGRRVDVALCFVAADPKQQILAKDRERLALGTGTVPPVVPVLFPPDATKPKEPPAPAMLLPLGELRDLQVLRTDAEAFIRALAALLKEADAEAKALTEKVAEALKPFIPSVGPDGSLDPKALGAAVDLLSTTAEVLGRSLQLNFNLDVSVFKPTPAEPKVIA